jgi:hypothetical protein
MSEDNNSVNGENNSEPDSVLLPNDCDILLKTERQTSQKQQEDGVIDQQPTTTNCIYWFSCDPTPTPSGWLCNCHQHGGDSDGNEHGCCEWEDCEYNCGVCDCARGICDCGNCGCGNCDCGQCDCGDCDYGYCDSNCDVLTICAE